MSTAMFQPKADRAQWEIIYQRLCEMQIGDEITYEELEAIVPEFALSRAPYYRAVAELERSNQRTLSNVRGQGYRMVEAREHERLAKGHHRRARRQVVKGLSKLRSADRARLTPEERDRFDRLEATVGRHADMLQRLDGRVAKQEAALERAREESRVRHDQLAEKQARLERELAALKEEREATGD